MNLEDAQGNPTSTSSPAALAASEQALWRMMSFYGTPIDDLDVAIAADPAWLLPRAMKAGFLLSLTEPALLAEASALLDGGEPLLAHANARERAHLAALRLLARGDWQEAAARWAAILCDHPRDALALQWALLFDFHRGDANALRERVERVLPAWSPEDALHPYVLGHHAFGLEESRRWAEAEAVGRQALAAAPRVPWALHAVAHVMEMQGRHEEGAAWMGAWRRYWGEGNGFAGHLGWHEALFGLEARDHAAALATFDRYLNPQATEVTLQRLDAASLLWRLDLHGADVGNRWRALVDGWALDEADAGHSAFNDLHATIALVGAGELVRARAWRDAAITRAETGGNWNRSVMREIGAPLLDGLLAFGHSRFAQAIEQLAPLRGDAGARVGGSHAQRDLVDQTLLAAAARGGMGSAGRALLAERMPGKRATPLALWWQEMLDARSANP